MSGAFTSRRRAEEFDALLSSSVRDDATAAPYADLLEVVGSLRSVAPVSARPDFVADLRSRLVVEAARMASPVDDATRLRLTPRQRQGSRERRLASVLGGFAIVAASGSMAMASQAALPGDVLYPVKRALENAETNLQSDDAAKAEVLLGHAEQRLQEAEQLAAQGADAEAVAATLHDFSDQSSQAAELALDDYAATGDQATIGQLRSFTAQSMSELSALGEVVPSDARAALITAAQNLAQADSAAFQLCPTCGDGAVTEVPEFAAATVPLTSLLTYETTSDTIPVSRDFLAAVEEAAENTPMEPVKGGNKGSGGEDSPDGGPTTDPTDVTDPATDPVTDPGEGPGNPLEQLGDRIKEDLASGNGAEIVDETVSGVVNGVGGLVDGLLGN
ncbi:DUF5667 domain-containing protein [Nocardioides stalactiti]|uniref:DUF5667 domain-containing protein n=1 Tax=Nocardioides stalactiti TaxID=2755356 RepID=UPI001601F609|nr:DUF5667 domain-containing protein [Nocardioides stalactiti]